MIKLFKVVELTATSSRPLEVQGMAKYQVQSIIELVVPLELAVEQQDGHDDEEQKQERKLMLLLDVRGIQRRWTKLDNATNPMDVENGISPEQ